MKKSWLYLLAGLVLAGCGEGDDEKPKVDFPSVAEILADPDAYRDQLLVLEGTSVYEEGDWDWMFADDPTAKPIPVQGLTPDGWQGTLTARLDSEDVILVAAATQDKESLEVVATPGDYFAVIRTQAINPNYELRLGSIDPELELVEIYSKPPASGVIGITNRVFLMKLKSDPGAAGAKFTIESCEVATDQCGGPKTFTVLARP